MRQTALISLLWSKNLNVLHYYLKNRPRLVLAMAQACTPELRSLVEGAGSQLMALDSLVSSERRREIHAEVAAKLALCRRRQCGRHSVNSSACSPANWTMR